MAITGYTDGVYEAIKTFLTASWTDTPIQWPNQEWNVQGEEAWVKVEIHGTVYGQQSIGASEQSDNRWDDEGVLWLHLGVPRGSGYSPARGAAKALANLFRGRTLLAGRLEFLDATIGSGHFGDEEGTWFLVPVSIEWRHMDA